MSPTSIEWTRNADGTKGETWNPATGCDRVSPGCDNCYALTLAKRLKAMGQPKYQRDGDPRTSGPGFALTLHPDSLALPLRRRKPTTWFVNSMSDLFHPDVPLTFLAEVWQVMHEAHRLRGHRFQILTKRPQRMARALGPRGIGWYAVEGPVPCPEPGIWLGTSIELDKYAWRANHVRATPAAVRFLSLEPLLGPLPSLDLAGIDWVLLGGESGRGARPVDLGWIRDLIAQCRDAGAAPFVKQLGSRWGRTHHDIETWPEGLRVREWPHADAATVAP